MQSEYPCIDTIDNVDRGVTYGSSRDTRARERESEGCLFAAILADLSLIWLRQLSLLHQRLYAPCSSFFTITATSILPKNLSMASPPALAYAPASVTVTRLDADVYHPHDPLTASEISLASACFRTEMLNRGLRSIKSCAVTLLERKSATFPAYRLRPHFRLIKPPLSLSNTYTGALYTAPKAEVIAYLGLPTSPTDLTPNKTGVRPARRAEAHLIDVLTGDFYVTACTFPDGGGRPMLDGVEKLPKGVQPAITLEEMDAAEEVVRNDPEIIRLCAEVGERIQEDFELINLRLADCAHSLVVGVSQDQIMADCWSIGYEHRFGDGLRLQQAFLYARLGPDEHLYAHPLDFNAVVDTNNKKVLKIGAADFARVAIKRPAN